MLALVSCLSGSLSAAQFGDFTYTDNGTTITITDYPTSAVGAVVIPDTIAGKPVTSIGDRAFSNCPGLDGITIPSSVTSINNFAFVGCSGLIDIEIPGKAGSYIVPDGATSVFPDSFDAAAAVTSVALPASLASIPRFRGCSGLESFSVSAESASFSSVGGVIFNKTQSSLLRVPPGITGAFVIPSTVDVMGEGAFADCNQMTTGTIPASTTIIENQVFLGCEALTGVVFPAGLTEIGVSTFAGCVALRELDFPASLTNIGAKAFYGCTGLKSVVIPSSVNDIGLMAFSDCSALASAVFTGNAPSQMGSAAFSGTADGFTVYFYNGKFGFTSPTWNGYPSVNMGAVSVVKPWLVSHGFPFDTGLTTDANNDGVSLLMAYALNLDPLKDLSGSMPKLVVAGNQMSLRFHAGSAGVTYAVEASGDLLTWSPAGVSLSPPDAGNFRTASVGMTGGGRFMRVVAVY